MRKLLALIAVFGLSVAMSAQTPAPPAGKKDHAFKGKVEKVDAKTKMVTVNNENIPGWMMSMTMTYKVDKDAVLKDLKPGDQIAATVYEGDFQTLYNIKVLPPKK
jgi:Cu/Ag efflux protein CusF